MSGGVEERMRCVPVLIICHFLGKVRGIRSTLYYTLLLELKPEEKV